LPALSHPIKKRIPEASAVILLLLVTLAVWLGLRLLKETAWVRIAAAGQEKSADGRAFTGTAIKMFLMRATKVRTGQNGHVRGCGHPLPLHSIL
jgi:hypothetical protein